MKKILIFLSAAFIFHSIYAFGNEIIILGNNYKIPKIYIEDGTPRGILIDIAKYIDGNLKDDSFHYKLTPWARAYKSAVEGQGGIIGLSKTKERLEIFDYSDVVYYDDVIVVVLKDKAFQFEKMQDLKGRTIGIGRGGSFGDAYEKAKKECLFKIEEDNGPVLRLRKLLQSRIDCALMSPGKFAFYRTIEQDENLLENKDKFIILSNPLVRDPNFLGFSKKLKMKNFLKKFNEALKQGYESGAINKIIDVYSK